MNCFIMKTRTLINQWYEFTMADVPTLQTNDYFVLMNKPDSPILQIDSIMRGDSETGLYEGDVIHAEGRDWLICYERGFRAIDRDYVIRYLYTFSKFETIGRHDEIPGLPFVTFKKRFHFKYAGRVFRLEDIAGAYEGRLILRNQSKPVAVEDVQQDCGTKQGGRLLYLGDKIGEATVQLCGGRIAVCTESGNFIDVVTGGVLDGYIPRSAR